MMLSLRKHISFALSLSVVLAACGGQNPHTQMLEEKAMITGNLAPQVEHLKSGSYASPCDLKNFALMSEIAKAVDEHRTEIDSYAANEIDSSGAEIFKSVKLGPMVVRETLPRPAPSSKWKFFRYSWDMIISKYNQVRLAPSAQGWSTLNMEVRSILTDDQSRIEQGQAYVIGHEDEAKIQALLDATKKCHLDETCVEPAYEASGLAWLQKQSDYSAILTLIKNANSRSEFEEQFNKLERFLTGDLGHFTMRKNKMITARDKTLNLPLYTLDLASITEPLSKYIETVWASKDLSLKIDWKTAPSSEIFTVQLLPQSGGRSYVLYTEKKVALFNNVRTKSIAHEIGHVLGFRDRYFDIWDEEKCEYEDQSRDDDIMSSPTDGAVLEDEWATLKSTYTE